MQEIKLTDQDGLVQADQFDLNVEGQIGKKDIPLYQNITIKMDPYQVLGYTKETALGIQRNSYRKLISSRMTVFQRKRKALASQILVKPDMYKDQGNNTFSIQEDIFHYSTTCDFLKMVKLLQKEPQLINAEDSRKQSILYLACQPGHLVLARYLLTKGIMLDKQMSVGSTALHAASYYGHHSILELLLLNGANFNIKNQYGNTAKDEAKDAKSKEIIASFEKRYRYDTVMQLIQEYRQKNLICLTYNVYNSKQKDRVEGIFMQIDYKNNPKEFSKLKQYYSLPGFWKTCYHGTKVKFAEKIITQGFIRPSKRGAIPEDGHIKLNILKNGIKNWADAVFVSQSPFMAANSVYSERVKFKNPNTNQDEEFAFVFQLAVKLDNFTEHSHTLTEYAQKESEPDGLEWRIKEEDGLVITGIYFMKIDGFVKNEYQTQIESMYGNGKITGIYGSDQNTLGMRMKFEDICLMGHPLTSNINKVDCDVCDQKIYQAYTCEICSFTRCGECKRKQNLI